MAEEYVAESDFQMALNILHDILLLPYNVLPDKKRMLHAGSFLDTHLSGMPSKVLVSPLPWTLVLLAVFTLGMLFNGIFYSRLYASFLVASSYGLFLELQNERMLVLADGLVALLEKVAGKNSMSDNLASNPQNVTLGMLLLILAIVYLASHYYGGILSWPPYFEGFYVLYLFIHRSSWYEHEAPSLWLVYACLVLGPCIVYFIWPPSQEKDGFARPMAAVFSWKGSALLMVLSWYIFRVPSVIRLDHQAIYSETETSLVGALFGYCLFIALAASGLVCQLWRLARNRRRGRSRPAHHGS